MATANQTAVSRKLESNPSETHDPYHDPNRYYVVLGLSEAMNDRLEELEARAGVSKAEILNQAVGLYKAISDAVRDGKRVGIVSDPDIELETEFVGF